MKRRGESRWGTIFRALSTVALLAGLGCGGAIDGGGRGTGIGAVTIAGNIASSGPSTAVDPMCPFAGQNAFVSVRGTNVQAPVEADCTFELREVPSGDVTLHIESDEGTNTLTINSVPPESVVVLTDVRLREDSTDVAAIEVRPATPAPPRAFAIIADPPAGDAPLAVQFSFAPDPLPGTAVTWTFGDRSTGSRDSTPAHVYDVPGDYVAALTVAEPGRQPQLVYAVVRATAPPAEEPLSVRLRAAPTSGAPPLTVEFEASVFGGRPATKFVWSFGDGSPQLVTDQAAVSHEYLRTGSFVTILTITDDLGREAGTSFPVVVERSAVTVRPTSTATARNGSPVASPTPSRGANAVVTPTATRGPRRPGGSLSR
jgi:PKD repeat protein